MGKANCLQRAMSSARPLSAIAWDCLSLRQLTLMPWALLRPSPWAPSWGCLSLCQLPPVPCAPVRRPLCADISSLPTFHRPSPLHILVACMTTFSRDPGCIRARKRSTDPSSLATPSAERPARLGRQESAPAAASIWQVSSWPPSVATSRALLWSSSTASISARISMRRATTQAWPFSAARCSGRTPFRSAMFTMAPSSKSKRQT
mmetsp:Transcript_110352/g.235686  ORF Transcript_110352/g.235686 Transcript_110352/m.235686 type:complete len:205 (+) Transcript_110352:131-745(+)